MHHEYNETLPREFGYLLNYNRSLEYYQIPDYDDLRERFSRLLMSLGNCEPDKPLNSFRYSVLLPQRTSPSPTGTVIYVEEEDCSQSEEKNSKDSDKSFTNSYFGWAIADWGNKQGTRERSLTLPAEKRELADNWIPWIMEVNKG